MNSYLMIGLTGALALTATTIAGDDAVAAGGITRPASFTGSAATPSGEYTVQWNRPTKVGQRMHVRGDGIQEQTVTTVFSGGKQDTESTNLSVTFEAEAQVLAVDRAGQPTRVSYTVSNCAMTRNGQTTEIAAGGTVITASHKKNSTIFQMNGRQLRGEVAHALSIVAGLETERSLNDNIVGSTQPRAIGESWAVNSEEAVKALGQQTSKKIANDNVFGVSTLVDVLNHRGQSCMFVHAQLSAENVDPGFDSVPSGMKLQRSNITSTYQGYLPVDFASPVLSDSMRMDMSAVLTSGRSSGPLEMRINGLRVLDRETTPLPSTTASISDFERVTE